MTAPRITIRNLHADLAASVEHFASDTAAVERSRARAEAALSDGLPHYGINTGFGALANRRVPDDQLSALQRNLLLSHAVGVGEPVPPEITRLMLRLKIQSLGLGYSGVSLPVYRRLVEFDRRNLLPVVPSRGSVGASGDLAPLAHLCLPLIGLGEFWDDERRDLIIDTIAEREKLKATESDIDDRVADVAKKRGADPGQVYASLQKAGRLQEIEQSITEEKVFAWLMERNEVG